MDRKQVNERGLSAWGLALAALACVWLLAASPASAATGQGTVELRPAQHAKGRTLSGQGVSIVPGAPTQKSGDFLGLPITTVELGTAPGAGSDGRLSFKRGKRSVTLSGIRLDLAAGTLEGTLGGRALAVFRLGAEPRVDVVAGRLSLSEGSLRLTPDAAALLKQRLGLERPLVRRGVGMVWLSARLTASPKPVAVVRPVVSGAIEWGFKASWRAYVLSPPAGSQEVLDGATATGPLSSPATTYGFPVSGGSLTGVTGSSVDALELTVAGAVKWAKPGHGINEVRFSDLAVEIGSDGSWLIGDVRTEIGPAAESDDVRIAELETTAVTPTWSAGGNTVTWSALPAKLTDEGAASFSGFYEAGAELDPVTVTVGLG